MSEVMPMILKNCLLLPCTPLCTLSGNPEYLPLKVPFRMTLGVQPLHPSLWIEPDAFYAQDMALREAILRERYSDVIVRLPGEEVKAAEAELLELLAELLPRKFPSMYVRQGGKDNI